MRSYACRKYKGSMIIDGDTGKQEWAAVEEMHLLDNVTGARPVQQTSVKMLWDDEFLFIAYKCVDDSINATLRGFNDKLYEEDVVEVFLDDDCDGKTYIEIEVNPLNAVLHYSIINSLKGSFIGYARLDNKIKSAVKRVDGKYTCYEMAIPFTEFLSAPNIPPKAGDRWLMNIYRIDRGGDGRDEYTAWSPTGKINYHLPESFGELVFSD